MPRRMPDFPEGETPDSVDEPVPDEGFDTSDEEEVARRNRTLARREKDHREVVAALMATPQGRAWVWDFLAGAHVYQTSFHTDSNSMAFREGERNVALMVLAQIMAAAPKAYLLMFAENSNAA